MGRDYLVEQKINKKKCLSFLPGLDNGGLGLSGGGGGGGGS